jgi:peptide deformylase
VFLNLKRPKVIRFSYLDIDGIERNAGFSGITARIFQHEYDHMEGKNFTMYASRLKLDMALKKAKKKIKKVLKTS